MTTLSSVAAPPAPLAPPSSPRLLHRVPPRTPPGETLPAPAGRLQLDLDERTVYLDGVPVELTYQEFELLAYLMAYPNRVHTRERLLRLVWRWDNVVASRTVDSHVARLRRKLAPVAGCFETVYRVGYRFRPARGQGA